MTLKEAGPGTGLAEGDRLRRRIDDLAEAERVSRPVVAWAWIGVGFIVLTCAIAIHWIGFSGTAFQQVTAGRSEVPSHMRIGVRIIEFVVATGTIAVLYLCLIRPWRRAGRLSGDGLLLLAAYGVTWQDPLYSYTGHFFTYNSAFVNIGSWGGSIPGFMAPHPERIVYPLAICFGYGVVILAAVFYGSWVMRLTKAKFPRMGKFGQILVCYAAMIALDIVFELTVMWLGWYTLSGAGGRFTIFSGRYYQYPLYEGITWGGTLTLYAALRHFRDDSGLTYVERGLNRLRQTGWRRTGVRLLALTGAMNVIWFGVFEVPSNYFRLHQSAWPADIVDRPYFNTGLCEPGVRYTCDGWQEERGATSGPDHEGKKEP